MIKPQIFTQVPETDPALVREAREIGVSDLHEGLGAVSGRMFLMSARMRPLDPAHTIAGPAVTAFNYPGDNLMAHLALYHARPGQVLVMTNAGGTQGALWGELTGLQAQAKNVAGLICDGPVRDTQRLVEMRFPVWSTSIHASHPEKRGPGSLNVPIVVDNVVVNPGDIVVADADGVIVIPRDLLRPALEFARQRQNKEIGIRTRLAGGAALYDILEIEKSVARMDADIRDTTWQDAARNSAG
jgi:4-hydroxy-4-methyl-2-oxoglutarate aldolase